MELGVTFGHESQAAVALYIAIFVNKAKQHATEMLNEGHSVQEGKTEFYIVHGFISTTVKMNK